MKWAVVVFEPELLFTVSWQMLLLAPSLSLDDSRLPRVCLSAYHIRTTTCKIRCDASALACAVHPICMPPPLTGVTDRILVATRNTAKACSSHLVRAVLAIEMPAMRAGP